MLRQPVEQLVDPGLDRNLLGRQQHPWPLFGPLDDGLKGAEQAEQIDFELRLEILACDARRSAHQVAATGQPAPARARAAARGGLELLVLEQPSHQGIARILFFAFDARRRFRPRQQHLRLDVNQSGCHHEELPRDIEVQLLHQLNGIEVLLGDQRNRNVVDVDLVALDEMKQEVERAVEVLELDGKRVDGGFEVGNVSVTGLPSSDSS